jgi:hypothetical protein
MHCPPHGTPGVLIIVGVQWPGQFKSARATQQEGLPGHWDNVVSGIRTGRQTWHIVAHGAGDNGRRCENIDAQSTCTCQRRSSKEVVIVVG